MNQAPETIDVITDKLIAMQSLAKNENLINQSDFEILIAETSPDVVYEILTSFKTTLKECIEGLKNRATSKDDQYKICHKLKGSALLIGFQPLGDACVQAMNDVKHTPNNDAHSIANVITCAQRTQDIVYKFIL